MLVFVDESGDTGLGLEQGASPLFAITLVVFEENEEAQAADDRITVLRRELGKSAGFEFHFKENSDSVRQAFFDAVVPYNFFYFGFVINKETLYRRGFPSNETFYKYVCGRVFENAKPYLDSVIVKIDSSGSRQFQQQLAAYLKTKINDSSGRGRHISKVSPDDSHRNNLLQLADMVCGAVARSYRTDRKEPQRFRRMIKHREISVVSLPGQEERE